MRCFLLKVPFSKLYPDFVFATELSFLFLFKPLLKLKTMVPRHQTPATKYLEFPVKQFGDGSPLATLGNILQPVSQVEDDKETN